MKNLFFLFFILLIVSCSNNSETEYLISEKKVYLKVGTNTSEEELVKISTELLAERNITVDFQDSEFDDDGKLMYLNLKVDCNDDFRGSTKAEKVALMVSKYGFVRDYSEGSDAPFRIGSVN